MCKRSGLWIGIYFVANFLLTTHTKWVLSNLNLQIPWLLSGFHITVSGIGAYLLAEGSYEKLSENNTVPNNHWNLLPRIILFGILHAANIGISNAALGRVSLATHQITRSISPVVSAILLKLSGRLRFKHLRFYLALIPVTLGVLLASLGNSQSEKVPNVTISAPNNNLTLQSTPSSEKLLNFSNSPKILDYIEKFDLENFNLTGINLNGLNISQLIPAIDKELNVGQLPLNSTPLTAGFDESEIGKIKDNLEMKSRIAIRSQTNSKNDKPEDQINVNSRLKKILDTKLYCLIGISLALSSVLLGTIKSILASILLTGSNAIGPLDALWMMAPFASFVCTMVGIATGELQKLKVPIPFAHLIAPSLVINGLLAFVLNVSSFTALKLSNPLTLAVAGNIKQAMCIIINTLGYIDNQIIVGVATSLAGGLWYK